MILVQHGERGIRVGNRVVPMEFSCVGVLAAQCLPHLDQQFVIDREDSLYWVEDDQLLPNHFVLPRVRGGDCIECGVSDWATAHMEELGYGNAQVVAKVKRCDPPLISALEPSAVYTIHVPSAFICTRIWSDTGKTREFVWDTDRTISGYREFLAELGAGRYCVAHPHFTFLETV